MRVALLTYTTAFAGTERHMLDLAYALRAAGVETELACPAGSGLAAMAHEESLPVYGMDYRSLSAFRAINTIRANLRSGRWEVVHAHNGYVALLAACARWLARRGTLVATQHFIDPARTKRRGWRAWLAARVHRWVDRQTDGTIAISEAVKEALLARDATPPEKVHVAINGIRDPAEKPLVAREAGVRVGGSFRDGHADRQCLPSRA